jgi:hypothetical protein
MKLLKKLLQHRLNELLLFRQETTDFGCIKRSSGHLALCLRLELGTKALLENLQAVLRVLSIQFRQVADSTNTDQDRLILDERRFGSETSHHADAFSTAKGLEGLVFDIPALEHNCGSLRVR